MASFEVRGGRFEDKDSAIEQFAGSAALCGDILCCWAAAGCATCCTHIQCHQPAAPLTSCSIDWLGGRGGGTDFARNMWPHHSWATALIWDTPTVTPLHPAPSAMDDPQVCSISLLCFSFQKTDFPVRNGWPESNLLSFLRSNGGHVCDGVQWWVSCRVSALDDWLICFSHGSRLRNGQVRNRDRCHGCHAAGGDHEVHHPRGHGRYHRYIRCRGGRPHSRPTRAGGREVHALHVSLLGISCWFLLTFLSVQGVCPPGGRALSRAVWAGGGLRDWGGGGCRREGHRPAAEALRRDDPHTDFRGSVGALRTDCCDLPVC